MTGDDDATPVLRSDQQGVSTLTLNRPAARNALSRALIDHLPALLADVAGDKSVKVVVLAGAGSRFAPAMTSRKCGPIRTRNGRAICSMPAAT